MTSANLVIEEKDTQRVFSASFWNTALQPSMGLLDNLPSGVVVGGLEGFVKRAASEGQLVLGAENRTEGQPVPFNILKAVPAAETMKMLTLPTIEGNGQYDPQTQKWVQPNGGWNWSYWTDTVTCELDTAYQYQSGTYTICTEGGEPDTYPTWDYDRDDIVQQDYHSGNAVH